MSKINYTELQGMMSSLDISKRNVGQYLTMDRDRSGPFSPRFVADRHKVAMNETQMELDSIVDWANAAERAQRQKDFKKAIQSGDERPVLVSEGDSWFQYPYLVDEIIDHLSSSYLVWSLGAARDTVSNMLGPASEYMHGLGEWEKRVSGFLFSGGGNDVIGEDESGRSVLEQLLRDYDEKKCAAWHIQWSRLDEKLNLIRDAYSHMIATIHGDTRFKDLPIFVHGYDYPFPYPFGRNDRRSPGPGEKNEWLGRPFKDHGFPSDNVFAREVLSVIIDSLYAMMNELASQGNGRVFVVNVRGSMPDVKSWYDELHGTSRGFISVAERFQAAIARVV